MTRAALLLIVIPMILTTIVAPGTVQADQVFLHNGRVLDGRVQGKSDHELILEMSIGQIGVPLASVAKIVPGSSPMDVFDTRAAELSPDDVEGWLSLATWAQTKGLNTRARLAFETVVQLDPRNEVAQRALGKVPLGDRWMTPDERNRELGMIQVAGKWMTPEQYQAEQLARQERTRSRENSAALMMVAAALAAQQTQPVYPYPYPVWGGGGIPVLPHPPVARPPAIPYRPRAHTGSTLPSPRPLSGPRHRASGFAGAPTQGPAVPIVR